MKPRTPEQNASLHLGLRRLADALNDAGLDVRQTLKEDFEIPWNEHLTKELIFRPVMEAMTNKKSTTELDRLEPSQIWDVIMKHLGERFGVYVPFPTDENRGE